MPQPTIETPTRPVRRPRRATVVEREQLTPHLIRLVLGGEGLEGFAAEEFSDHYVKLLFPPAGAPYGPDADVEEVRATLPREQWPRTRTYTVRAWDPAAARLTLDVVVHGDVGFGGPWASAVRPGGVIQLLGPGGSYAPDPAADWHLLIGDPSVVPAIAASLPRIPDGVPVVVLIEADGPDDELPLDAPPQADVRWLRRAADEPHGAALLRELASLELPAGRPQLFLHGEAGAVRAIRRELLIERGLPREGHSISGYWKHRRDDEAWRAEKAEWNRQVEADGA